MRAARKLNDAVEEYLRQNVPQTSSARVIVRIYANLTNLSLQLGKMKLTGLEKRSIASFTAAFTRALSLFDFVDTLDDEGTKFKIRGADNQNNIMTIAHTLQNISRWRLMMRPVATFCTRPAATKPTCPNWYPILAPLIRLRSSKVLGGIPSSTSST